MSESGSDYFFVALSGVKLIYPAFLRGSFFRGDYFKEVHRDNSDVRSSCYIDPRCFFSVSDDCRESNPLYQNK